MYVTEHDKDIYFCPRKAKNYYVLKSCLYTVTSAKATKHKHQHNLPHKHGASNRFLPSDSLDFFVVKSFAARD